MQHSASQPSQSRSISKALLIIIPNLLPLVGVIFWGWDLANVILLYWLENIILGFWTIAKMLTAQGKKQAGSLGAKLFICCFFTVHYGIFCFGHLAFILSILNVSTDGSFIPISSMLDSGIITNGVLTGSAIMLITHGLDFFQNYLSSEQRKQDANTIMFSPYGHIVIIHVAILFSAFIAMLTGQSIALLILIIIGKIALEFGTLKFGKRIKEAIQQSNTQ